MKTVRHVLVGMFALLLCNGCASTAPQRMYSGAPRPASEITRLVIPIEVNLLSLDGVEQPLSSALGRRGDTELELLPGRRRMTVRYYMPNSYNEFGTREELPDRTPPVDLSFDAEAGKSYRVAFEVTREGIRLWVVDDASGQPAVSTAPVAAPAEKTTASAETTAPTSTTVPSSPAAGSGSQALRILQDAWHLASPEDRASFRRWLEAQP